MKKLCIMLVVCFLTNFVKAQVNEENEVSTSVLKLQDLISHAADNYPSDDSQQIYLLIETNENGISSDAKFYLEQGVKLLLKRLKAEDKIAIGTYGYDNRTMLPYTDISKGKQILASLSELIVSPKTEPSKQDGIDLAYQFSLAQFDAKNQNKVIMLRNDQIGRLADANAAAMENGVSKKEKRLKRETSENPKLGGAIMLTALSILPEILEVIKN